MDIVKVADLVFRLNEKVLLFVLHVSLQFYETFRENNAVQKEK